LHSPREDRREKETRKVREAKSQRNRREKREGEATGVLFPQEEWGAEITTEREKRRLDPEKDYGTGPQSVTGSIQKGI